MAEDTVLRIPRITYAPKIEDFNGMAPDATARDLARAATFIQRTPSDGKPATERTEAYLGYDQQNLYVIALCWDHNHTVRGSLTRREPGNPNNNSSPFQSDDYVESR